MPLRPIIGITLDLGAPDDQNPTLEIPADYPAAILHAGGTPILLPFTPDPAVRRQMISMIHGLLIPGGRDIDPQLYGQPPHPKTKILSADRTDFDLALLSLAQQQKMPTLGICLGCQLMNVHRRGTLHQHLPDAPIPNSLQHSRPGDRANTHDILLRPHSALANILNHTTLPANSRHHQAIDRLGDGLQTAASAPDGVIEAIEDPALPFWLAVQWHPENLSDTPHQNLFSALVAAAQKHASTPPT